jgi:hypothetical protein
VRIIELVVSDPYKSLWSAVLGRAADDIMSRQHIAQSSAKYWFKSRMYGVGSFCWICDVLDLDPDKTMAAVFSRGVARGGTKRKIGTIK